MTAALELRGAGGTQGMEDGIIMLFGCTACTLSQVKLLWKLVNTLLNRQNCYNFAFYPTKLLTFAVGDTVIRKI